MLSIFCKVYERCKYDQIYEYFNNIFSKQQSEFHPDFAKQHCLLVMTEKWQEHLDEDGVSGALLTDLSKAFDFLLHDLLIAKLATHGFNYESLMLMQGYLSNRKQRAKVKNT